MQGVRQRSPLPNVGRRVRGRADAFRDQPGAQHQEPRRAAHIVETVQQHVAHPVAETLELGLGPQHVVHSPPAPRRRLERGLTDALDRVRRGKTVHTHLVPVLPGRVEREHGLFSVLAGAVLRRGNARPDKQQRVVVRLDQRIDVPRRDEFLFNTDLVLEIANVLSTLENDVHREAVRARVTRYDAESHRGPDKPGDGVRHLEQRGVRDHEGRLPLFRHRDNPVPLPEAPVPVGRAVGIDVADDGRSAVIGHAVIETDHSLHGAPASRAAHAPPVRHLALPGRHQRNKRRTGQRKRLDRLPRALLVHALLAPELVAFRFQRLQETEIGFVQFAAHIRIAQDPVLETGKRVVDVVVLQEQQTEKQAQRCAFVGITLEQLLLLRTEQSHGSPLGTRVEEPFVQLRRPGQRLDRRVVFPEHELAGTQLAQVQRLADAEFKGQFPEQVRGIQVLPPEKMLPRNAGALLPLVNLPPREPHQPRGLSVLGPGRSRDRQNKRRQREQK